MFIETLPLHFYATVDPLQHDFELVDIHGLCENVVRSALCCRMAQSLPCGEVHGWCIGMRCANSSFLRFRERQNNLYDRALAFLALHLNGALVSFDNLLRLEKTYPQTIPFCRMKRL